MGFFKRLGLGLTTSVFSLLLVVFAIFISIYMVLDRPDNLKQALRESDIYSIVIENTLTQQKEALESSNLPLDNPEVKAAFDQAFSPEYVQSTSEQNIDATYDWLHGTTQKPNYQVDVSQPKEVFASNIQKLVSDKLGSLPACTKPSEMVVPSNAEEVLSMKCRPPGLPTELVGLVAGEQVKSSSLFSEVANSVATLEDSEGRPLTDKLSIVPEIHRYYIASLYVIPAILLLCAVIIFFGSASRRWGLRTMGRILIGTGITTMLLSIAAIWLLGKGVDFLGDQNASIAALQTKLLEVAHIIGSQLRNWLVGIGGGYVLAAIALLCIGHFWGRKKEHENQALNSSLGYSTAIPKAGTTFDPTSEKPEEQTPADKKEADV